MSISSPSLPEVATREEWRAARIALLQQEKELTRQRDRLNADRRRLPMVAIPQEYVFEGPEGPVGLIDLFDGRRQLIVYHFMLGPTWTEGCPGCSFLADNIGHLSHLHARNTTLVFVSRAPLESIARYQSRMGWTVPWFSSLESEFNFDFHVTLDKTRGAVDYNFEDASERLGDEPVESHGTSVFLREGERVFHTYSSFARGCEMLLGTYHFLDLTPLGRQEDWEVPAGRSDGPFMSWLRRHDQYEQ